MAQGNIHKLGVPGSDVEEWGVRQKSRFFSTSWKRPPPPLPWPLPTSQPQSLPLPMNSPSPCPLSLLSLWFLFPIPIHYWANYCLSFKALLKCSLLPGASEGPWIWAGCTYSYAHCLFSPQGSSWKPGPCLCWSPSPSIPPATRPRVGTPCRGMNENDNYIYQTIALESKRARERNVFHPAKQSRLNFCSGGLSDVQGNCRGAGECGFILSLELRVPLRPATHIHTGTTLGCFYHSTSNLSGLRPGSNSLSHYPPHPETNFEVSLRFSGGGRLLRRGPRPQPITEPLRFPEQGWRAGGRERGLKGFRAPRAACSGG